MIGAVVGGLVGGVLVLLSFLLPFVVMYVNTLYYVTKSSLYSYRKKRTKVLAQEEHTYDIISDKNNFSLKQKGRGDEGVYSEIASPAPTTFKGDISMNMCAAYQPSMIPNENQAQSSTA